MKLSFRRFVVRQFDLARCLLVVAVCVLPLLAACSQQNDAPVSNAPTAAQQAQSDAADKLKTYRQLLQIKNDELAASLGESIVKQYPDSDAAKEVQQTLPDVEARWKENSQKRRLTALWTYQVGPMEGGTQSTASLYSTSPAADHAVRLVLRRHTSWGQSVFLFDSGHGFVCRGNCTIQAQFDGKSHPLKAFLPTTGEPAMFITDDKAFIAALAKTGKITMDVERKDDGKRTLVFETGGFDPTKWADTPAKNGAGKGKK